VTVLLNKRKHKFIKCGKYELYLKHILIFWS